MSKQEEETSAGVLRQYAATQADKSESLSAFAQNLLSAKRESVIMFCDVVESVRWMEQDEDAAIARWGEFVMQVRQHTAPAHGGQVIKSTGDGLLIEFQEASSAIAAAKAIQKIALDGNARLAAERQMHLRIGVHQAPVRRDEHDLYGHGVNLAARITALAAPGEIVVTPEVRDHLTDALDGEIVDLGECYMKHLSEPQRVYRVGQKNTAISDQKAAEKINGKILLACIPPICLGQSQSQDALLGVAVIDNLISQLGQSKSIKVVSRLSTQALASQSISLSSISNLLGATHAVTGSLLKIDGKRLSLTLELSDCVSEEVLWSKKSLFETEDLFASPSQTCSEMAVQIHQELTRFGVDAALSKPIPSLPSFALLQAGITLMHRSRHQDFENGVQYFDSLIDRHKTISLPHAWRARWRLMKIVNGLSDDPNGEAKQALWDAKNGLDHDPSHPLSLAIYGQIQNQLLGNSVEAGQALNQAISRDASEPMAWLFKSIHSSMWGDPQQGVIEAKQAIELSRFDPHKYHYQMALASALLANGQHQEAITHAQASLRLNAQHAATQRILITAYYELGMQSQAMQMLDRLRQIQPDFSTQSLLRIGTQQSVARLRTIAALAALGA